MISGNVNGIIQSITIPNNIHTRFMKYRQESPSDRNVLLSSISIGFIKKYRAIEYMSFY